MTDQTVDATVLIEDLTLALEGRYVIGDALGFGRGGVTLHARHVATGRELAIKVAWDNALAREQVQRETALTASVAHPHVLPVRGVDMTGPILAVEMPLAAGSVDDLLEPGTPVPFARVVSIVAAAAGALDQAHANGIVHGGLRPTKLLLDENGEVLVTDFALRVPQTSGDQAAKPSTVGTAAYTPVEQRHDLPTIDGRVDQFALAVIAYELLRGRRMFNVNADGVLEIDAVEIMPGRPLAAGVPLSAGTAIRRATSRDPGFRYGTVAEFAQALSDASLHAAPAEQIYRANAVGKKRRSALWMMVPIAALVTAAVALKPEMRDDVREWWHANWSINMPHAGDMGPSIVPEGQTGKPTVVGTQNEANRSTRRTDNTRVGDSSVAPRGTDAGPTFDPPTRNTTVRSGTSSAAGTGGGSNPTEPASRRVDDAVGSAASSGDVAGRAASDRNSDASTSQSGAISATISGSGTAIVVIDGVARGTTPLVWQGRVGKHRVSVRGLQSFSPESVTVTIARGDTARVAFTPVPRR